MTNTSISSSHQCQVINRNALQLKWVQYWKTEKPISYQYGWYVGKVHFCVSERLEVSERCRTRISVQSNPTIDCTKGVASRCTWKHLQTVCVNIEDKVATRGASGSSGNMLQCINDKTGCNGDKSECTAGKSEATTAKPMSTEGKHRRASDIPVCISNHCWAVWEIPLLWECCCCVWKS